MNEGGDTIHENPSFGDVMHVHNLNIRVAFLVECVFIKIVIDFVEWDTDHGDQSTSVSLLRFWPWVDAVGILFLDRFFVWGRRFIPMTLSLIGDILCGRFRWLAVSKVAVDKEAYSLSRRRCVVSVGC